MSDEVQCWHIEPGTPCDWNICRQPERLAAGDIGTDPKDTPPTRLLNPQRR
ncbi:MULTISPECIES: hypothetical protein [Streptomyces]|uniref:hypothetical protein n=1 Tax=Streptomyces TaxID=1883 RepID=UPI00204D8ED1|nr:MULTISPECIES: hypothetical protein [Streptomyces]UPT41781.1 hypothetical protein MWG59_10270 [Streptomyces sp. WAC00303]WIY76013.1 hypothetical protein QPM16_10130 [Streptomyces anulatus]